MKNANIIQHVGQYKWLIKIADLWAENCCNGQEIIQQTNKQRKIVENHC